MAGVSVHSQAKEEMGNGTSLVNAAPGRSIYFHRLRVLTNSYIRP